MERMYWSSTDIRRLFKFEERIKSLNTLFNAEKRGEIPQAERVARGSVLARLWRLEQLPLIGQRYGFLRAPTKQVVISIYTPKGGVLKSTLAYNLAKILALHNIKTLIVGLDVIQSTITNYALPPKFYESIEELDKQPEYSGLYHHFFEKTPLSEIILPTALPSLDIIPETPELQHLIIKLLTTPRREFLFKDKLIPQLPYQVIIFDNGPGWNLLVESSLAAANTVIVPMGCEIEAYKSIDKNLEVLFDYKTDAKLEWDNFFQVATLVDSSKISRQIKDAYIKKYIDNIITPPLRRNPKGQEARAANMSIFEYAPTSELAQDYYSVTLEIWQRILEKQGI
jgi:chromosome partitioning protein